MAFTVTKVDVWSTEIADEPGGLAAKLEGLASVGSNPDFLIARRQPDKPGSGIVFITGIKGTAAHRAAKVAGMQRPPRWPPCAWMHPTSRASATQCSVRWPLQVSTCAASQPQQSEANV